MADEENKDAEETEAPEPGSDPSTPEAEDSASADEGSDPTVAEVEETPAEEEAPAKEEAPAEEEAPAKEEAPAEEAPAPDADAEPEVSLTPKQARKLARSTHAGEARPQRTAEERATERTETRRRNAAARSRRRGQERAKRSEPRHGTPPAEREPGVRRTQLGTVVSDKADKTITVRVDLSRRHRRYEKVVRQSATVHAHDEGNEASAGDIVRVIESRPLSRTKRWRLVEVVEKAR